LSGLSQRAQEIPSRFFIQLRQTTLKNHYHAQMPILPLDHPEPFAATLGTMLYPGVNDIDVSKARAFVAQWLAKQPYQWFHEAGHRLRFASPFSL